ncbi:MAG: hypothetical protein ACE5HS_14855 [bacterium]
MSSKRNKFDKKDSLELGEQAEQVFVNIARSKGWRVQAAESRSNIDEHWDFWLIKDEKKYRVDVKACKRIRRQDSQVQDKWVWIELHGVRAGDRGWLFDGKADLLAFETRTSFIIVKRSELIDLVNTLLLKTECVKSPENAQYKVYTRKGRPDQLTLIETAKLQSIQYVEWPKPKDSKHEIKNGY